MKKINTQYVLLGIVIMIIGIGLFIGNLWWHNLLEDEYLVGKSNPNEILNNMALSENCNYLFAIIILVSGAIIGYAFLNKIEKN